MKNLLKKQRAFTLIELLIYMALLSAFLTSAITFAWDIIYGREKAFNEFVVSQNAKTIANRIEAEIRTAESVSSVSEKELILSSGSQFILNGSNLQYSNDGANFYNLNSNQVLVSALSFSEDNSSQANNKIISFDFTVEQAAAASPGQVATSRDYSKTILLNGQFNQSSSLLLDASNSTLSSSNRQLLDIVLENTSSNSIIIDQLAITWTGAVSATNFQAVQIDGLEIWSGSVNSGSLVDLSDFTINSGETVNLDSIDFDGNIAEAELEMVFYMGDGSTSFLTMTLLESGVTPTPTPTGTITPTPTPTTTETPTPTLTPNPNSCAEYCQNDSYSGGICRKAPKNCTNRGEVYQSAADYLCIGNKDSCCCQY